MTSIGSDGAFYLSLGTMFFAFLSLSIRYCFYSKCTKINICGLICERDVKQEVELREFEINHNLEMKGDEKQGNNNQV